MLQKNSLLNVLLNATRALRISSSSSTRSPASKSRAPKLSRIWLLLCIPLFAACAGLPTDATQTRKCNVPREDFQPTTQPPLRDETMEELIAENAEVRKALDDANDDKARALKYIEERC